MLSTLSKLKTKSKKRVGQGWGSGRGKYSGRGVKGQHARGKTKLLFEGGQLVLQKKLPMLRGKLKNKTIRPEPVLVKLSVLEASSQIKANSTVTLESLQKAGIVSKKDLKYGGEVKILSQGTLTKKLTVRLKASARAVEKIKAIGGDYQP